MDKIRIHCLFVMLCPIRDLFEWGRSPEIINSIMLWKTNSNPESALWLKTESVSIILKTSSWFETKARTGLKNMHCLSIMLRPISELFQWDRSQSYKNYQCFCSIRPWPQLIYLRSRARVQTRFSFEPGIMPRARGTKDFEAWKNYRICSSQ